PAIYCQSFHESSAEDTLPQFRPPPASEFQITSFIPPRKLSRSGLAVSPILFCGVKLERCPPKPSTRSLTPPPPTCVPPCISRLTGTSGAKKHLPQRSARTNPSCLISV